MSLRLVVVPRWAGRPDSDFYPWLVAELAALPGQPFDPVIVCDLPDPGTPKVGTWPPAIAAVLGTDLELLSRTFVLGHSVGCQALLHAIGKLPNGAQLAGMLAVAGWWRVDRPWSTLLPWIEQQPPLARVRAALPKVSLLLSDDDPFTEDYEANAALWRERLGATAGLVPGAAHFNGNEEPTVLEALLQAIS